CLDGLTNPCVLTATGQIAIDWQRWWLHLLIGMNWIIPALVFVPGIYLLMTDLGQEIRRGTLNFIRLSPQSSYSILGGKILGTPALIYLAFALVLPLHWAAAIGASAPLGFLISFYGVLGATGFLLFSAALLCVLISRSYLSGGGAQLEASMAFIFILLVAFGVAPIYIAWNIHTVWYVFPEYLIGRHAGLSQLLWFSLPLSNPAIAHAFTFLLIGLATTSVWHSLQRCFHNPATTLISKKHGYGLVAWVQITLLGFLAPNYGSASANLNLEKLIFLCSVNVVGFLLLTAALLPHRQTLLDWARFRRDTTKTQGTWNRVLVEDLLWGERSPATLAIAVNLVITALIWVPWILLWPSGTHRPQALVGLLMSLGLILVYGAIAQLMLFMKSKQRNLWATATIGLLILSPPLLAAILSNGSMTGSVTGLMLFSPFLWATLDQVSKMTLFLTVLGQFGVLGWLNFKLTRLLQQAGASESKQLITGNQALLS
ncbi:MAG: hypothetical protein VKJ46_00770, partial [Leptolyngbyaceae bacterium]|nr:hypothetical protein [Leptolyngbyaceae bacterium]